MGRNEMKLAQQVELEENFGVVREDELSPEQWAELWKRTAEVEAGTATMITIEELKDRLRKWRRGLPVKK